MAYEAQENANSYAIDLAEPGAGLVSIPVIYRDGMKVTGDVSGDLEPFRGQLSDDRIHARRRR